MPAYNFHNKVFLVIGAGSGIGKEISSSLLKQGAIVLAASRRIGGLSELKNEYPDQLHTISADITEYNSCKKISDYLTTTFGNCDGLIYSAGISLRGSAFDTDIEVFERLFKTNFFGFIQLYKLLLPLISKSKGTIVAVSSMQGKFSLPGRSAYSASKHAITSFLDTIRIELIEQEVHVMNVIPGYVKTEHSLNALKPDGSKYNKMDSHQSRGLPPEKVAKAVLKGISKKNREIYPAGLQEKAGFFLSRICPALLDKILFKRYLKMRDKEV